LCTWGSCLPQRLKGIPQTSSKHWNWRITHAHESAAFIAEPVAHAGYEANAPQVVIDVGGCDPGNVDCAADEIRDPLFVACELPRIVRKQPCGEGWYISGGKFVGIAAIVA
jgi:hypothetical protein